MAVQASSDSVWINEGRPVFQGENATIPWTVTWAYATTVSSPTVQVFKLGDTTDAASTYMPSGSHTTSGNSLTMKNLTVLVGGEDFIVAIQITVDGIADEFFMKVHALHEATGLQ